MIEPQEKIEEVQGYLQCYTVRCTVDDALRGASDMWGVSYSTLRCIAFRESTLNPFAENGRYHGLMQFDYQTWSLTPYRDRSIYDEYASAGAAAYLISIGQASRWPTYRGC